DYCKQRFAQVTNPPIDPLREAHVMSLRTCIGPDYSSETPVLSQQQLLFLENRICPGLRIDVTFQASRGVSEAYRALERVRNAARSSDVPRMIVLSDRYLSSERAALPILLAASAVWQELSEAGSFRIPLVVETAQAFDTPHVALLLAVGATAV